MLFLCKYICSSDVSNYVLSSLIKITAIPSKRTIIKKLFLSVIVTPMRFDAAIFYTKRFE